MSELWSKGAKELGAMVAAGEVRPSELVDAHIERVKAVNPALNAMVNPRFEAAREEAAAADLVQAKAREGELPPLFGVPCTIKEFFAFEGMPHTGGILARRDVVAAEDATLVARIKEAGAIVMGSTNAPEGGLWMETHNLLYGRTNNPWNVAHTCGGSSGGEAALIAAGASPFGLGSDIGGSIRIPAAMCGVVGHKPSGRLIPTTGHFPPALGDAGAYLCAGPLARKVEDVALLTDLWRGPDGRDAICVDQPRAPLFDDLRGVTVLPIETNGRVRVRADMRVAVDDAARALADRGATVIHRDFPRMKKALRIWSSMLSVATDIHYGEVLGGGRPIPIWSELLRLPFGGAHHSYPALILAAVDQLTAPFSGWMAKHVETGIALQAELEEAMGPRGVILHPPYSRPAPRHNFPWLTPFDASCTALFNVMEFPVTQVPIRLSKEGLPIGVQVAGCRGQDAVTLSVALALEEDFGGWQRADPPV
jgi:fatty acid amide hydrolase 2